MNNDYIIAVSDHAQNKFWERVRSDTRNPKAVLVALYSQSKDATDDDLRLSNIGHRWPNHEYRLAWYFYPGVGKIPVVMVVRTDCTPNVVRTVKRRG